MQTIAIPPHITPEDRLGLTICLALIVHVILILGISFGAVSPPENLYASLEIILVPEKFEQLNDDAEMLAQTNLVGGDSARQSDPQITPIIEPPQTAEPLSATAPPPTAFVPVTPTKPERSAEAIPEPTDTPEEQGAAEARQELTKPVSGRKTPPRKAPIEQDEVSSALTDTRSTPLPTATQLLTRSFALASVNAELQQRLDLGNNRPRRKYISANTREFRYAAYMEAWRAKVERVGNINYPDEARRRQLSGTLLLDVALSPDGSVKEITVRRSSGHKVLDEAAARIVRLAAPFAPFPPDIQKDVDILHVTRTWKFLNNQQFSGR